MNLITAMCSKDVKSTGITDKVYHVYKQIKTHDSELRGQENAGCM